MLPFESRFMIRISVADERCGNYRGKWAGVCEFWWHYIWIHKVGFSQSKMNFPGRRRGQFRSEISASELIIRERGENAVKIAEGGDLWEGWGGWIFAIYVAESPIPRRWAFFLCGSKQRSESEVIGGKLWLGQLHVIYPSKVPGWRFFPGIFNFSAGKVQKAPKEDKKGRKKKTFSLIDIKLANSWTEMKRLFIYYEENLCLVLFTNVISLCPPLSCLLLFPL